MVIVNRYTKMYGWLNEAFRDNEFTIDEFRTVFPSPQPTKTAYDLIKLNYITRINKGKYKVTSPREFVKVIVNENKNQINVLDYANRIYAFSNDTAVRIWTEGYYWTNFTKGFKPIHLKVLKKDLGYWKKFFRDNDIEFALDNHRIMFGVMFILHPSETVLTECKDGNQVVPLEETISFCKENILVYEPALTYISDNYGPVIS